MLASETETEGESTCPLHPHLTRSLSPYLSQTPPASFLSLQYLYINYVEDYLLPVKEVTPWLNWIFFCFYLRQNINLRLFILL